MSEISDTPSYNKPSATGAFFRGFLSSALTSITMMAAVAGVAAIALWLIPTGATTGALAVVSGAASHIISTGFLGSAGLLSMATGLFGGIMGVKHAMFGAPHHEQTQTYIPVPVAGMSGPAMTPMPSVDNSPEQAAEAPARWTDKVEQQQAAERIQQILANGSNGDKDRTAALLASREAAAAQSTEAARA